MEAITELIGSPRLLRELLHAAPDGIVLVDSEGRIVLANAQLEWLFGYLDEELIGERLDKLLPERYHLSHRRKRTEYLKAPRVRPMGEGRVLYGRRRDGNEFPVEISLATIDTERGRLAMATVRDVSDRLALEDEMRRQTELLATVFDNAPIGEALVAPDGTWLRVNRALCEIVGYSREELLASTFQDITHPEDLDSDLELLEQTLAGEIPGYQMEKRYLHKSGHAVWIKLSVSLVRDREGEPLHFISQIEDITAAKETERALQESEARLRSIVENIPAAITLRDLDGRYQMVNSYTAGVLGRSPEEIVGSSPFEHHNAQTRARVRAADARLLETGEPITDDVEVEHSDGSRHTFHVVMYPVRDGEGTTTGFGAFSLDVTERKQAEQRLRERERDLAEAQAIAHLGFWEQAIGEPRVRWSDEMCRIFGLPVGTEPTVGEFLEFVHPDDREGVENGIALAIQGCGVSSEYRILRSDGELRYVHSRRFARLDEHGSVTHIYGTIQDISKHKRAERALRTAQEHSEAILAAMSEGYVLSVDGEITEVNQALLDLTGFTREELIGSSPPLPFWPPEELEKTLKIRDEIVASGGGRFQMLLMRKSGERFDAEVTSHLARTADGRTLGFVSTIRDVSERKRYEQELKRLATNDALTGLPNHRVFHERLRSEVARAVRHGRPLSVAVLDLDYFKQVNDRYGHLAGDEVLREVAARLGALVRREELFARVGGEEFAWILPDADVEGAYAAAERARQTLAASPIEPAGLMTLSAGVAELGTLSDPTELYDRADRALYFAKGNGRDKAVVWDAERGPITPSEPAQA